MADTEHKQVYSGAGAKNPSAIITALEGRIAYVVKDGENPQTLNPGNVVYIIFGGRLFRYDATDATTAHDGVSCVVTADGKRFKADAFAGAQVRIFAVKDRDLSIPPGAPVIGDRYIVAAAGTGAWATKDKQIAEWTARGWLFTVPNAHDLALVIDEALYYHYSGGGVWTAGLPALTIGADSVFPGAIKYGRFGFAVVNQTTDAPPGSPADGDAYVIGAAPTGAWAGRARDVAIWQVAAWAIYEPYDGATVYDRATDTQIKYEGGAWTAQTSGYAAVSSVFTAALVAGATNLTGYTYSATAGPTTANANEPDTVVLAHAAKKVGAVLEITYEAGIFASNLSATGAGEYTAGLQIDSDAAMTDWALICGTASTATYTGVGPSLHVSVTFLVTVPDTASHEYGVKFFARVRSGAGNPRIDFSRRRIIIRERS